MIKHYPYATLGHADHGWLDAHHHFSFADYWNDDRVHFGELRVINDDRISPGHGFGTHGHNNMEIITYVRQGAITHKDNLGNIGRTVSGDVQVMSAGTGVHHSEQNSENIDTRLYQIWIMPNVQNVKPRWDMREFPKTSVGEKELSLLVSGRDEDAGRGALFIHQDAAIYGGRVPAGATVNQLIKHQAYILASSGKFVIDGIEMGPGDGAEVTDMKLTKITAMTDAEILVIDVPKSNS